MWSWSCTLLSRGAEGCGLQLLEVSSSTGRLSQVSKRTEPRLRSPSLHSVWPAGLRKCAAARAQSQAEPCRQMYLMSRRDSAFLLLRSGPQVFFRGWTPAFVRLAPVPEPRAPNLTRWKFPKRSCSQGVSFPSGSTNSSGVWSASVTWTDGLKKACNFWQHMLRDVLHRENWGRRQNCTTGSACGFAVVHCGVSDLRLRQVVCSDGQWRGSRVLSASAQFAHGFPNLC